MGSMYWWQALQVDPLARCAASRSRTVVGVVVDCGSSGGIIGGGGGITTQSRFSEIHFPRRVGDVRSRIEVTVSVFACVRMPAERRSSGGVIFVNVDPSDAAPGSP